VKTIAQLHEIQKIKQISITLLQQSQHDKNAPFVLILPVAFLRFCGHPHIGEFYKVSTTFQKPTKSGQMLVESSQSRSNIRFSKKRKEEQGSTTKV
jgi:hypothetical protein